MIYWRPMASPALHLPRETAWYGGPPDGVPMNRKQKSPPPPPRARCPQCRRWTFIPAPPREDVYRCPYCTADIDLKQSNTPARLRA